MLRLKKIMSNFVKIIVDNVEMEVPAGATVVDAAMRYGVKIPVFCHHPKLEPVGMCRMCLVRIGMPMIDRASGQPMLDAQGNPQYNWGKGLQTGCTVRVAPGMKVETKTADVLDAREDILEFLLSSHPLDCPICDKGGECPLQNLTLAHGEGKTRFYFEDKMKQEKHVPLGDLIFLDRERCIQCARCTRYQDEVAGDPVIAFHNRGRRLEIVTLSDPGFDSIWSGNTTDICPVGALTTADFRFGARPWELVSVASLSPHGPVGENTTISARREAKSGGRMVVKRVMPRQNELVNELWIPDKARFVHHYSESAERLTTPLIRKNGKLVEASWDEAITLVAQKLQQNKATATGLAGERLSNEDFALLQKLFRKTLGNNNIDLAHNRLAGGEVTAKVGIAKGTHLGELGKGDVIAVFATDLHVTAPIWWLRLKNATKRGAKVVVFNVRPTRLDQFATHVVHYAPNQLFDLVKGLGVANTEYAKTLREAENLLVYYGHEGLNYAQTGFLATALGNFLVETNHVGRLKNGLVAVWEHCNTQGAWDMGVVNGWSAGYQPVQNPGLNASAVYHGKAKAVYIVGSDPIGSGLLKDRSGIDFLAVQELFLTETAKSADVVLPAQSWAERDGTWTNGDRRVQRYYPAATKVGDSKPDWQIIGEIIAKLSNEKAPFAASLIFAKEITKTVPAYAEMTYRSLAEVVPQHPIVTDEDFYYSGTNTQNTAGMGQQWATAAEAGPVAPFPLPQVEGRTPPAIAIPTYYIADTLTKQSAVVLPRIAPPTVYINSADATKWKLKDGATVGVKVNGQEQTARVHVNGQAPSGIVLLEGFGSSAKVEM